MNLNSISGRKMGLLPRRFSHFVFGIIQSGLTSAVATGVASFDYLTPGTFLSHWVASWLVAWLLMLPIVVVAAPIIRRISFALTSDGPRP